MYHITNDSQKNDPEWAGFVIFSSAPNGGAMKTTKSSKNTYCSTLSDSEFTSLLKASRNGDTEATNKLLMANYPLVIKISTSVVNKKNVPSSDLINLGCTRFLEVINSFDETKGTSLSTYIWKPICQYINKSPEMEKTQIYDFQQEVSEAAAYLKEKTGYNPSYRELANFLHASFKPFLEKCQQIISEENFVSLDKSISSDGEDNLTLLDTMACAYNNGEDASAELLRKETIRGINQALNSLSKKDRETLLFRIDANGDYSISLRKASKMLNIATQTIRNHEFAAIEKFRQALCYYGVLEDDNLAA